MTTRSAQQQLKQLIRLSYQRMQTNSLESRKVQEANGKKIQNSRNSLINHMEMEYKLIMDEFQKKKQNARSASKSLKIKKQSSNDYLQIKPEKLLKLPKLRTTKEKDSSTVFYPISIFNKHIPERRKSHINMFVIDPENQPIEYRSEKYLGLSGQKIRNRNKAVVQKYQFFSQVTSPKASQPALILHKINEKSQFKNKQQKLPRPYSEFHLFIRVILNSNRIKMVKSQSNKYKCYIGEGNNSPLVKSLIRKRHWWTIVENKNQANFLWTQNKNKDFIDKLQCNQPKQQIGKEYTELQEQDTYAEKPEQQPQEKLIRQSNELPSLRRLSKNTKRYKDQEIQYKNMISNLIFSEKLQMTLENNDLQAMVNSSLINESDQSLVTLSLKSPQIHNHLECHWNLSNKKALFSNMKEYYQGLNKDPFIYIPRTYHVKHIQDQQHQQLIQFSTINPKQLWIVKPGENTNRGTGINVSTAEDLQKHISNRCSGQKTVIVQIYVLPMLYHNRKFDIRCYLLVTSLNNKLKAYWYQQGYIRTSSKQFSLLNISSKMIHLTNDAIQKHSQEYGKYEPFNKLSFKEMEKYFNENKRDFKSVRSRMKRLATDCIKATCRKLDPKKRNFTFQIFGLDFLIDHKNKTWLIEVNTNPCLELSGSLLSRLIPHMLENSLRIALDPIFQPPEMDEWPSGRRAQYSRQIFSNNKFSLIFDQFTVQNA